MSLCESLDPKLRPRETSTSNLRISGGKNLLRPNFYYDPNAEPDRYRRVSEGDTHSTQTVLTVTFHRAKPCSSRCWYTILPTESSSPRRPSETTGPAEGDLKELDVGPVTLHSSVPTSPRRTFTKETGRE